MTAVVESPLARKTRRERMEVYRDDQYLHWVKIEHRYMKISGEMIRRWPRMDSVIHDKWETKAKTPL